MYFELLRFFERRLDLNHLRNSVDIWEVEYEKRNYLDPGDATTQNRNDFIKNSMNGYLLI